jgi:hypothetical protein
MATEIKRFSLFITVVLWILIFNGLIFMYTSAASSANSCINVVNSSTHCNANTAINTTANGTSGTTLNGTSKQVQVSNNAIFGFFTTVVNLFKTAFNVLTGLSLTNGSWSIWSTFITSINVVAIIFVILSIIPFIFGGG